MVTPSEYDALADLFLSNDPASRGVSSEVSSRFGQAHATAPAAPHGMGHAAHVARDANPLPAVVHTATAPRLDPSPTPRERVEALILGHLPVLASGWVGQYAKQVSESRGEPVALVRSQGDTLVVDLIASGRGLNRVEKPFASLGEALAHASARTRTFLVRVDEVNEARLAEAHGLTDVTLLTSADEAALVSCYRTLKYVAGQMGDGDAGDPDMDAVESARARVRVCVMGAPPEKATEAKAKLERTAAAFLRTGLGVEIGSQRLSPGVGQTLYRGPGTGGAGAIVEGISGALARAGGHVDGPSLRLAGEDEGSHTASRIGPSARGTQPATHASVGGIPQVFGETESGAAVHGTPHATAPVVVTPMVARMDDARRATTPAPDRATGTATVGGVDAGTSLTPLIAGLTRLAARCPYAPGIELAMDATGSLHLVGSGTGSGFGGEAGASDAVAKMLSVSAWARDHIDLIRLGTPGLRGMASGGGAVMHLVVEHAKDSRRWLDSGVRVHAIVRAGGAVVGVGLN